MKSENSQERQPVRDADELRESGLTVLDHAYCAGAFRNVPLFSGGHDSLCACQLASQHRSFQGAVHHINTTIGSDYTRAFVERVCHSFGWKLIVHTSPISYEQCVRDHGFPGPGGHQYIYNRLKDRCIRQIVKGSKAFKHSTMLINGSRAQESIRRMGHAEPVQFGEVIRRGAKAGSKVNCNRTWTAPCHDWSKAEQQLYMDEWGLPINRLKVALGLSGECFCGAFAAPGEREMIRQHAPDVEEKIVRLEAIAKDCGKPCEWGKRPPGKIAAGETGIMCSGCDMRAASSGLTIIS